MLKRQLSVLSVIAAIVISTNVQAQSRFELSSSSTTSTEVIAGVIAEGRYTIHSGFIATQSRTQQAYGNYLPLIRR